MSLRATGGRTCGTIRTRAAWMRRLSPAAWTAAAATTLLTGGALAAPQQDTARVTPQTPGLYKEEGLTAPPLPGYAIMAVLGVAVIGLSLWSSKRTQLD